MAEYRVCFDETLEVLWSAREIHAKPDGWVHWRGLDNQSSKHLRLPRVEKIGLGVAADNLLSIRSVLTSTGCCPAYRTWVSPSATGRNRKSPFGYLWT